MAYVSELGNQESIKKNLKAKNLSPKINMRGKQTLSRNKKIQNIVSKYWWAPVPIISMASILYSCYSRNKESGLKYNSIDMNTIKDAKESSLKYDLVDVDTIKDDDEINKDAYLSDNLLRRYLKSPIIPENVKDVISNITGGPYITGLVYNGKYNNSDLSSERGYTNMGPTNLEKKIDKLVDNGLSHLKYTTEKQLDDLIKVTDKGSAFDSSARFYDGGENDEKYVTGDDFFKYESAYNSMAVVCSQYNALEACGPIFDPVSRWPGDGTQGPRMSLSALVFAKLRESSYLKQKLNDAIDEVLGPEWKGKTFSKGFKLYSHGYLKLDQAIKFLKKNDKDELKKHIKANIHKFKLNFQWVLCNDGKTPMIQVFAAAPCLQYEAVKWWEYEGPENKAEFYNPICKAIQVHQMKMVGKLAKLRRMVSGKPFALHAWFPGGRSFKNHPDVLQAAAEALIDEVRDIDIDVFFHNRTSGNPGQQALIAKGINFKKIIGLKIRQY